MSFPAALLLPLAAPVLLQAQARLGSLLYADPVGRGIQLVVVDGGSPDRMTLRRGSGHEDRLRKLVLALAGPERFEAGQARALVEPVPPAWRVGRSSGGTLLQAGAVTYWRYRPGQVLPVRFTFEGRPWALQSADLPARIFPRPF